VLQLNTAVSASAQPIPDTVSHALQRRARLRKRFTFFVYRKRLLGQEDVILDRRIAIEAKFMRTMARKKFIAFDALSTVRAYPSTVTPPIVLGVLGH
jgi:Mlc titration factor MtfA (ptsG expression regulator)